MNYALSQDAQLIRRHIENGDYAEEAEEARKIIKIYHHALAFMDVTRYKQMMEQRIEVLKALCEIEDDKGNDSADGEATS